MKSEGEIQTFREIKNKLLCHQHTATLSEGGFMGCEKERQTEVHRYGRNWAGGIAQPLEARLTTKDMEGTKDREENHWLISTNLSV